MQNQDRITKNPNDKNPESHETENQPLLSGREVQDTLLTRIAARLRISNFKERVWSGKTRTGLFIGSELCLVLLWALIITRPYLDMDPTVVPSGRELLSTIQIHHIWTWARECGTCALWNSGARGGSPAFVDPQVSLLHPLVIGATLIWGVVNGSKVVLVASFFLAGLAQWCLGHVLGLGRGARVWGAGMAVAAGYLAARMNLGSFALVPSSAAAALVFPPLVALARTGKRRAAVLLGAALALVLVSGNGYMQLGIALTLPVVVFLIPWERKRFSFILRRFLLACGLMFLFAGPFIVPFMHFLPEFGKDFDISFKDAQPLAYLPLNLVIRDTQFFLEEVLEKPPWPSHYVNYIGWIPVLLAIGAFFGTRNQKEKRGVIFLGVAALTTLWISSGAPLAWLAKTTVKIERVSQLIGGFRYPAFIAGLAVPPLLALAAIGLDKIISRGYRKILIGLEDRDSTSFHLKLDPRWLVVIPLAIALNQARTFGSQWIGTMQIDPFVTNVLEELRTPDLQWVSIPWGEHFFVETATGMGLKLSPDFSRTWHWKGRPEPEPVMEANRGGVPEGMTEKAVVEGFHILVAEPGREYAVVEHPDGSRTICTAHGLGGKIDVTCDTTQDGILVVIENNWSGWRAQIDGRSVPLRPEIRLSVEAPAGSHDYSFRYLPWDVFLGVAFLIVGVFVAGYLWWRSDEQAAAKAQTDPGK